MLIGAAEVWSRTRTGLMSGEYHSLESTTQALLNRGGSLLALQDREQVPYERTSFSVFPFVLFGVISWIVLQDK
jgi:hypothetical protein